MHPKSLIVILFEILNPLKTNVPYHIETSQLVCNGNQLTGFYTMGTLVFKGLNTSQSCG